MHPIRIVGIGGSLRQVSTSLTALSVALQAAQVAGASTTLFDVRTLNLPLYNPDNPIVPPQAGPFMDAVEQAHGLIWCSPLYHGIVSGAFKNVIDWMDVLNSRERPFLTDKIVGLACTAGGMQGLQAINTMEFIARSLRAWSVPLVVPVPASFPAFDTDGQLRDEAMRNSLGQLGREVYRACMQFAVDGTCDYVTA